MQLINTSIESRKLYLLQVRQYHQRICQKHSQNPQYAEYLLPQYPTLLIFHSFQEELPERIQRRLAGEAIMNVLIILVRFEPELVAVREKQQAEEEKDQDKSERRVLSDHFEPPSRKERKGS